MYAEPTSNICVRIEDFKVVYAIFAIREDSDFAIIYRQQLSIFCNNMATSVDDAH